VSSLVKQGRDALGVNASHLDIAKWACESVKMRVKYNSWCAYKSSHKAVIEDPLKRAEVEKYYKENSKNEPGQRRERRPSKRLKSISEDKFLALMSELKREKYNQWAKPARIWFTAMINTGIRPMESIGAEIISLDQKAWLRVKNAKTISATNDIANRGEVSEQQGRNRGIYRNIPIEHLSTNERNIVSAQIAIATKMHSEGIYDDYYHGVRAVLSRASRALWPQVPKAPSLYTARHTFKDRTQSRLLNSGYSTNEVEILIAAMMGHGSRKTQYCYGINDEELIEKETVMAIQGLFNARDAILKNIISEID
jgi:hypothetical protein